MGKIRKIDLAWISILLMICTLMYFGREKRVQFFKEKNKAKIEMDSLKAFINWKQERYNIRMEICDKQDEIIERFQSSRNAKFNDTTLMNLIFKLND